MQDKINYEEIQVVSKVLGLSEKIVEKDIYVTKLIHALADLNNPYYKLVFQGGTCLSKAYDLVPRMSEDWDFRIQSVDELNDLSREKQRETLKVFRTEIFEKLKAAGFRFNESDMRVSNEGKFISLRIEYLSNYHDISILKPFLAVDFFLAKVQAAVDTLPITTLIKKILGSQVSHPELSIDCISVVETAAEKWVALTRRIATIKHRGYYNDPTLVRHLYDLLKINQSEKLDKMFVKLVNQIIEIERKKFKTHNVEYFKNPAQEIEDALKELSDNRAWWENWSRFVEEMVFENDPPSYEEALSNFKQLTYLWLDQA